MSTAWVLVALVLVALAIQRAGRRGRWQQQDSYERGERAAMPPDIAQGELVYSERKFHCHRPSPLVARVDQVYRARDTGRLVPVETKTRNRAVVYLGDILELSVQAVVLANTTPRHGVAEHGYVRLVVPGRAPRYERVALLGEPAIVSLRNRRDMLLQGAMAPTPPATEAVCRSCGQRSRCPRQRRG